MDRLFGSLSKCLHERVICKDTDSSDTVSLFAEKSPSPLDYIILMTL